MALEVVAVAVVQAREVRFFGGCQPAAGLVLNENTLNALLRGFSCRIVWIFRSQPGPFRPPQSG
jgi:hypothetical protein